MDFMKILKSVEEVLFELVSWFLFYPLTFWRSLRHPLTMMTYADNELEDEATEQYIDAINPPMFLMITLLLAHWMELRLVKSSLVALPAFLAQDSNLLAFRGLIYSVFPFLMALKVLMHRKTVLNRNTLKPPFYAQCYAAAPFAFALSVAAILTRIKSDEAIICGFVLTLLAVVWYMVIQIKWLRIYTSFSRLRAFFSVLLSLFLGFLTIWVASFLLLG